MPLAPYPLLEPEPGITDLSRPHVGDILQDGVSGTCIRVDAVYPGHLDCTKIAGHVGAGYLLMWAAHRVAWPSTAWKLVKRAERANPFEADSHTDMSPPKGG